MAPKAWREPPETPFGIHFQGPNAFQGLVSGLLEAFNGLAIGPREDGSYVPPPVLDAAASPERQGFREMAGQPGDFREVPPPRLGAWAFRAP